ncbi:MAG: NPCBM/NEW2 domain-containing protein [Phycisphaerae bacterium]
MRVRLETLDGRTVDARVVRIEPDGRVVARTAAGDAVFALADLDRIDRPNAAGASGVADTTGPRCVFFLEDGGRLAGRFVETLGAGGAGRRLRVGIGLKQAVDLPFDRIAGIRFAAERQPAGEDEFQTRLAARAAGRDLLIVLRSGKPVVLPGAMESLSPEGWSFRFGRRTRSAALEQAYAVVLGRGAGGAALQAAMLRLIHDERLHGRIVSADAAAVVVDAGAIGRLAIPWSRIERIDLASGRVVYLSDLNPIASDVRSVFGTEWPVQWDRNVTGGAIALDGRTYRKGIGVHAHATLTWELEPGFERVLAVVGLDDSVRPRGSVVFRVRGDGRLLFESDETTGSDPPRAIAVEVAGVRRLTLECDESRGLDIGDHADWANARLIRSQ